jgi:protein involved in polysaccharide export with SLBB domain
VITFNRISRVVTINGEVERPGTYQIVEGENLKELIGIYAGGFTELADNTRMELVRLINSTDIAGNKIYLTEDDIANNYALEHYDAITVPDITKLQPVMFLEGAIGIDLTTELITTNRIVVQFATGETYASLIRKNTDWFSATSDAQNAYILRDGKRIPINLYPMLYDTSYRDDVQIFENDTLVIPFKQYFVTVAGAVYNPGRYPYLPDRNWEYYIALAGGFVPERNVRQSVTITGMNGKRMKKTDAILPETIVTANTNHGLYYFNQVAPVVTTVLSIVSTLLTINAITR